MNKASLRMCQYGGPILKPYEEVTVLTEEAVNAIRLRYAEGGITQLELGRLYGVTQSVISKVILYQLWKHVGNLPNSG